jgi:hypothetical protein
MKLGCIGLKGGMDLGGQDLRAQIYGQEQILEPPHLSTFKRRGGGGGPELRAHLSDDHDQSTRINGAHRILEPPHLSTFKWRGGGVQNRGRTSLMAMIRAPGSMVHKKSHPSQPLFF